MAKEIPEFTVDVITCDTPTARGRIYPKSVIENALPAFKKMVKAGIALGFYESQQSISGDLSKASHLVTKIELKGSVLRARIRPLATSPYKIYLEEMYRNKEMKFYMRGLGNVNADRIVTHFDLLSIDIGSTT